MIVLLVGAVGGIAIGSVSAADRTESSFNVFLKSTNPSDMSAVLFAPNVASELSRLPLVAHVDSETYGLNPFPQGPNAAKANRAFEDGDVAAVGTTNGEYITQDKPAVIDGRRANPKKADEFVMTPIAERLIGWHVGEAIPMSFYSNAQVSRPNFNPAKAKPQLHLTMHLVGTVVLNNEVVSDEVDQLPARIIFTPALTRPLVGNAESYVDYSLQLAHGARDVSTVEREIIAALPKDTTYTFLVTSEYAGQVNRSVEPEAIALGVFGLIAALATLIIAGGLLARELQRDERDGEILRALGGNPSMVVGVSLLGLLGAIVAGAVIAVGVGVALSPFSPIGPVRAVYPDPGISFDWSVLGSGFAVIVVLLGACAFVLARRRAQHSALRERRGSAPLGSTSARFVAEAGLPISAVVGVRFALGTTKRGEAAPVRSALLGAVLAVAIVVTTLTFGSSLNTLVSHPALFGWNWDYAMASSGSVPPQAARLLNDDRYVAAWSGVNLANAQINGLTVPILLADNHAAVSPPLLSGHEVDADNQIVLGAATLQALHKRVGDTVIASYGSPKDAPVYVPPTRMLIVGTTTLPAVGGSFELHTSMGTGAIIPIGVEPAAFQKFITSPFLALNGKQLVLIRLRRGVSSQRALASLKTITKIGNRDLAAVPDGAGSGDRFNLLKVQYPAEIDNYRSIGATPVVLALGLALGAIVALGLTLTASVRRKRRDLALLRTLGFTRRQLRATIAWQASVSGVVGVLFGVPLGIVLGRWLWTLFARNIYAVPEPTVPVISVIIVSLCALVLANMVAALPGRSAARTSTAQVLRED
jgi:hypothetical protein